MVCVGLTCGVSGCSVMGMNMNEAVEYIIEWDMGEYAGFGSEGEARAYQRAHDMRGSVVTPIY